MWQQQQIVASLIVTVLRAQSVNPSDWDLMIKFIIMIKLSDKINIQIFLVTKHWSLKIPSKVLSVFIMPHTVHSRNI
jgi:hypothetical protein